jgi:hypothetical protein
MLGVDAIDDGERVEPHPMILETPCSGPDQLECRPAALRDPEPVVKFLGPVNARANEEAVVAQELAPGVVELHADGLEVVLDAFPGRMLLLE